MDDQVKLPSSQRVYSLCPFPKWRIFTKVPAIKFEKLNNCRDWIFLGPQAGPDTSIAASTESTCGDRHCGRHCGLKINIAPKIPSLRRQFHDTVRINGRKVNGPEKFGWRYTEKLSRGNT